jgi:protein TonB
MSILERKKPEADISRNYQVYLEIGLIGALLLFIVAFKVDFRPSDDFVIQAVEQEIVKAEEIEQTKQIEKPPPPPRPPVPVEVPNDQVVEEGDFDIDMELDLDRSLDLPPPPAKPKEEEEPEVFIVVEKNPELIGGLAELQRSIVYPEIARKAGIEGRVFLEFIVDERGRVVNPRVVRGIGGGCDEAALAAIQKARFKPGMQRGRPVKVKYSLPIVFKLQS